MAQISASPLPMLPHTLGQIAVRSGSLPDGMLRPGQNLSLQVMQSAGAGEQTTVKIAGRTLQAVLPTAVQVGDTLTVRVGRSAEGSIEMQLAGQKAAPALRPPARDLGSLEAMSRQNGSLLKVSVEEGRNGPLVRVGNKSYNPEQLGVKPESLPRGSWNARIDSGRLVPVQETPAQLFKAPPSLTPLGKEVQDSLQAAGRASSGNLLVKVQDTPRGVEIQIAGRSYAPAELGVKPGDLIRGSWMARLSAQGTQLTLNPANSEAAQVRQLAGQLALSGDPLAMQAALELAAGRAETPGTYEISGEIGPEGGIPWITLPGGQTAAIQMGPDKVDDQKSGAAHVELWGNRLGPVSIDLLKTPAGVQISVTADSQATAELKLGAQELSNRVRIATGMPAQVRVGEHQKRPLPPEGFESYG